MINGVRESFLRKPKLPILLLTAIVVALIAVIWNNHRSAIAEANATPQAYFTVDDGASCFVDSADLIPPFDHQGKPAYRARVFSNDGGDKKKWVGYLERYTPQGKSQIERARRGEGDPESVVLRLLANSVEVKKPGQDRWVVVSDPSAKAIIEPKAPDGGPDGIQVLP